MYIMKSKMRIAICVKNCVHVVLRDQVRLVSIRLDADSGVVQVDDLQNKTIAEECEFVDFTPGAYGEHDGAQ